MSKLVSLILSLGFLTTLVVKSVDATPLGNPKAPKGGTFTVGFAGYPKFLLYYLGFDELSEAVTDLVQEPLVEADPETYEILPRIASEWSFSPDKKTLTMKLNSQAKFSDGRPVTSEDVKFTWDTLFNPKNKTAPWVSTFGSFESCTPKDKLTIIFKAKEAHFKNLEKLIEFYVLPKHLYSAGDFNKDYATKMFGSGPYTLEEALPGEKITVKRNPNWWGASLRQNIGRFNFDKVIFKAVPDYDVQFEMFKKGDLDYYYFLISKTWATQTDSPQFTNHYVEKLKGENNIPYATPGIAWNLRRPLFQDRRVRLALSHLMNREKFINDLFYQNYGLATGPVPYHSTYHSPTNRPVLYDPKKARELLNAAGWTTTGSDGILEKDKVRFEFEVLVENPALQRPMTLYQEDLKQMGIKMNLRITDWGTMYKLVDDRQFDGALVNRSREVIPSDFGGMWGTVGASVKGSPNLTGYQNPELDKLAAQIDRTFSAKTRLPLIRKVDAILGADQPFSFGWESLFFRVAYWNRFSFPGKGFFNYSYWRNAFQYWWYDEAKATRLKTAMDQNQKFPN